MIPYIEIPPIILGPIRFDVSVLLVAIAFVTGHFLFLAIARKNGIDVNLASGFSASMLIGGLIVGHLVKLLYFPFAWQIVKRDPALLTRILDGQASFGGIGGGILSGWIYLRIRGIDFPGALRIFDCMARAFPYAWFFGRLHCVIVHDHPGVRTTSWLGVRYPDAVHFDLAVLEILFLLVMIILFRVLERRTLISGFFLTLFLASYGVFRLAIDPLHVDVVRRLGLSVDQWASLLCLVSAILLYFSPRLRGHGNLGG